MLAGIAAAQPPDRLLDGQHKLVFELGWRAYFQHVWSHRGDAILQSLHEGPLPEAAYAHGVPQDVREARTGVPVIDQAVRTLYTTGTLHNHARMWLASYLVHLRKIHWRSGAEWLIGHLLDGDVASNHLSWQWVAGTGSQKPYLFNADNVARFAPPAWHSPGTVVDVPYDLLDRIARRARPVPTQPLAQGVEEPRCSATRRRRPSSARQTLRWCTVGMSGSPIPGRWARCRSTCRRTRSCSAWRSAKCTTPGRGTPPAGSSSPSAWPN